MANTSSRMSGMLSDYRQLNTIPALLSVFFVVAGLYQFGGISDVTLVWLNDYTLTGVHAMIGSLAVYVIAFMSSETDDFSYYDSWEQGLILAAPILIVGYEYIGFIQNLVNTSSNIGPIVAFVVTLAAWGIAVR